MIWNVSRATTPHHLKRNLKRCLLDTNANPKLSKYANNTFHFLHIFPCLHKSAQQSRWSGRRQGEDALLCFNAPEVDLLTGNVWSAWDLHQASSSTCGSPLDVRSPPLFQRTPAHGVWNVPQGSLVPGELHDTRLHFPSTQTSDLWSENRTQCDKYQSHF